MGNKKLRYFAFSGIAVFILAIIYFIVSIYISMSHAEKISQPLFDNFIIESDIQSFNSEQSVEQARNYFDTIKNTVDKYSHIGAITITIDSIPLFAYPTSSNFIAVNPKNEPILVGSSPMLKTQSASLITTQGQQIVINAISFTLQPSDIYRAARIPFLVVLAYVLILFIIIIYKSISKDSPANESNNTSLYNFDATDYNECINEAENSNNDTDKTVIIKTPIVDENSFEELVSSEDSIENSIQEEVIIENERETIPIVFREQENSLDDLLQKKTEMLNESIEAREQVQNESPEIEIEVAEKETTQEHIEDSTISAVSDPMGLFSDITGLGWASYLEPRLDSELIRATSSEQDLSLVFVQVKDINNNIKAKKNVATILLKHFKFRDFVFEYTDDSFAAVLVNVDLDRSMVICENLYTELKEYLASERLSNEIGIGVSTRSLRIIPATRIITESQQALAHSFDEVELPIVAFRVNPEKYRDFVANTQA